MSNWFAWLDYGFMKNALIAILIITPLFGLMGTMIVNKKMAYFSDALGHSALTGIAVGVVCGMQDTNLPARWQLDLRFCQKAAISANIRVFLSEMY